tara:strand:- start:652 stop:1089 length:438 start_codon:yes stop_codon:yes gene_type:complete
MSKVQKIGFGLYFLFVLGGCATGQLYQEVNIPSVSPDEGRIYFYRNKAAGFGSGIRPAINVNGLTVGRAISGGFFYVDRREGFYQISVKSDLKENVVSIDLKNGEERYINLQTKVGLMTYRVVPVLVGPEKGFREMQDCKFDRDF